ncbi:MAG: transglutaminase domain-containing protein, partial [Acidobacteriota bacterium]
VDLDRPRDRKAPTPLVDRDRFLRSTPYLGHASEPVAARYAEVTASLPADAAAPARAEVLRLAVAAHLSDKNLDSVLATAEEAATQRSGDCTEHAVLLTALLRADGVPARIATGLIYVDAFAGKRDLFAYHMWSQAYLGGRWVDLDATLDGATSFDAAHLTLGTSALDDDGSALIEMAGAAPWIGQLRLEVVETGKR